MHAAILNFILVQRQCQLDPTHLLTGTHRKFWSTCLQDFSMKTGTTWHSKFSKVYTVFRLFAYFTSLSLLGLWEFRKGSDCFATDLAAVFLSLSKHALVSFPLLPLFHIRASCITLWLLLSKCFFCLVHSVIINGITRQCWTAQLITLEANNWAKAMVGPFSEA